MARTEVIMPQMGESVAEGTVVTWLKQVGDRVERDEILLEISTDKVDAEIPSPVAGTLLSIEVQPGKTVPVGTVIALVDTTAPASVGAVPLPAPEPAAAVPAAETPMPAPSPTAAPVPGGVLADVIMPQMGESVAEGTVVVWLKRVGDSVARDENLLEISTDKVDAEIPSPVSGLLAEILVDPGKTVAVGTVIARVATGGPQSTQETLPPVAAPSEAEPAPAPAVVATSASTRSSGFTPHPAPADASADTLRRLRSTPLVRTIARQHDVDLSQVSGSGLTGRVTKKDILAFIETRAASPAAAASAPRQGPMPTPKVVTPAPPVAPPPGLPGDRIEPLSVMRARIAEHMVMSRRTSPHAHTVHEIDFSRVDVLRKRHKAEFEARGANLTVTAFIVKAVVDALVRFPILNSSLAGDQLVYHQAINVGVAVALEHGLIVPVVHGADALNLLGIARAINDLADRARRKKLRPEEVAGGTFSVTNPGALGSLFGIPIINQPQVAILGCGAIKKRVMVDDDDRMAIRPMGIFCLSFDHRVVDGAVADHFMAAVRRNLEGFELGA